MKINFITLLISLVILIAALWARQTFFIDPAGHARYYWMVILTTSGILTVTTLFRLLRFPRHRPQSTGNGDQEASDWHRQHYRMRFAESSRPVFVQKTDGPHTAAAFTCPVHNLSETGISLICTGVYTLGQTVQGEIIFGSGRTATVNGVVNREGADRTCLRLHCTIDPPLLMAEQREQIVKEKANGPRPAVSQTVLDKSAVSLPSHSPKGICRLKRP